MIRVYCAVLFIVDKLAEILNLLVLVSIFIELVSHCVYFVKAMNKFFFTDDAFKGPYMLVRFWCMSPKVDIQCALIYYR